MIIHESDEIEVHYAAADSDTIVVFFASKNEVADGRHFWGEAPARKAGFAAIGVMPKSPNWYPANDFAGAIDTIRSLTCRYTHVITYGQSMGGYAALKYARSVGAETTLAFAPQWSIDPDDLGNRDLRFQRHFRTDRHAGMAITRADIAENSYVIHDPHYLEDKINLRCITSLGAPIHTVSIPFTGHFPIQLYASTPIFVALIDACRRRDPAEVRALGMTARRRAPGRVAGIATAALARRPRLAAAILDRHPDRFSDRQAAELRNALGKTATALPASVLASRLAGLRAYAAAGLSSPDARRGNVPTVSVFGSCRAYNPCALLAADGRIKLNQSNIFGFVHCAAEVLQQFRLITGEAKAPSRLRPYLNIGAHWQAPDPGPADALQSRFAATDVFIVEISSVRLLRFKAFLLQINRTRELLAVDPDVLNTWWTPFLRTGINNFVPGPDCPPEDVRAEVMHGLTVTEQPIDFIRRDIEAIARRLAKPVVFVSHFNADMAGRPIAQRSAIVAAIGSARIARAATMFDPTPEVLAAGVENALADAAHYHKPFEHHLASLFHDRIMAICPPVASGIAA